MEYERVGSGPVVVLLPGLGCDQRMWQAVADRLSQRFSVVQPHTWGGGALADRARELEQMSRQWGGQPAGIAGLSMGGYLAFECLRQWPQGIRAAALLDTTAYPDDTGRVETREQVLSLLGRGGFSQVLGAFVPSVLAPGLALEHPARDLMLTMARDLGPATFEADMRAILGRGDFSDVLQRIRVPVLFAAGEEDSLTPPAVARRMAAEVPGSRMVEIPAAGHMAPLENPEFTARVLGDFFGAAFAR